MIRLTKLVLLLILSREATSGKSELGYILEKYDESPGIYFENKGQASLYNTEWRTVVYVNLQQTTNQSGALEQ
jgi:hypothetical protein